MSDFHARQYYVAAAVTCSAMLLYMMAPQDKEGLYYTVTIAGLAFVFGKFTNGFGRRYDKRDGDARSDMSSMPDTGKDDRTSEELVALSRMWEEYTATNRTETNEEKG